MIMMIKMKNKFHIHFSQIRLRRTRYSQQVCHNSSKKFHAEIRKVMISGEPVRIRN